MERIERQQLREFQVVRHAAGVLETLIEVVRRAGHRHVVPEVVAQLRNARQRPLQPGLVPRHPDVVPQNRPELAMDRTNGFRAFHRQQRIYALLDGVG